MEVEEWLTSNGGGRMTYKQWRWKNDLQAMEVEEWLTSNGGGRMTYKQWRWKNDLQAMEVEEWLTSNGGGRKDMAEVYKIIEDRISRCLTFQRLSRFTTLVKDKGTLEVSMELKLVPTTIQDTLRGCQNKL